MVSVSEWLRAMTNQEQHQLVEELMYLLPDLPFHVSKFVGDMRDPFQSIPAFLH